MKDNNPIKNPYFVRYLIVFGIGLMIIWAVFDWLVLPILPPSLAAGLWIMGLAVCAIVWALLILNHYEKEYPDE
jgi:small-conductance mechanosensitive channel